jgi:hypothetical protein
MKLLMFVLGSFISAAAVGSRAEAQNYPWCAQYGGSGGENCGFTTHEQCMSAVSGTGGFCMQNSQFLAPAPVARRPATAAAATTGHQVQQKTHQDLVAPQPQ